MLRYSKYLIACAALTAKASQGPGLGVSVTEAGVNKGIDFILPYVFQNLQDLHIDEVDFDGGYLKNIDVHIDEPAASDISLKFLHASNGAEFLVAKSSVELTADFHYKWSFFNVDGKADIKVNKAAIDIELDTSTQPSTPAYELAPKLDAKKFTISINPDDIDIQLTGGLVAKIASILIPLLKSTVIPEMVQQIETTAITMINDQVDQDLQIYGSQEEIPFLGGVTVDYAQVGGPEFTADSVFQMGVNGTFFDAQHVKAPADAPAAFTLHDPKGKDAQGYLTDYTIQTALESGFTTGNTLDLTYLLKEYLNVTVTTDNLGVLIPEILTKYGSGKAVGLSGMFVKSASTAKFTAGQAAATSNLQVTVTVDGEQAIQASFMDMDGVTTLSAQSGKLFGKISTATVGTIDAASFVTTLGLSATDLQSEIQSQLDAAIVDANQQLADGVEVPDVDLDVEIFQGYAKGGATLTTSMWARFSAFMGSWKRHLLKMKDAAKMKYAAPYSQFTLENAGFIF